ncbi:hypothetical protein Zmor_007045 [Zophobas morio]|uniref:Uncharacterized protein n=1 Tax=Zophobas morio TaxID=2755281 RepID=A0AA38IUV7_9CUCU|nr:hypothetical protein Zmor_007045 [Zophobas morio]
MAVSFKYLILFLNEIALILTADTQCENNCLRKCCASDQSLKFKNATCVDDSGPEYDFPNVSPTNIIHGKIICEEGLSKVRLDSRNFDFQIQEGKINWEDHDYDSDHSCVDTQEGRLVAFVCVAGEDERQVVASVGNVK